MADNTLREDEIWRWPTNAAVNRINSLLNISEDQYSQDWEFEISDSNRLLEYLDIYENQLINQDERFAMMSVVIDAFEGYELKGDVWGRIRKHLENEFDLHQYTIFYWCIMGEKDLSNCWDITPRMRDLWNEFRKE